MFVLRLSSGSVTRWAGVAAPAVLLAALEIGLSLAIPDTAVRSDRLPVTARLSLAACGLTLLLLAVAAAGGLVVLLGRVAGRHTHRFVAWTVFGLQAFVVWMAVFAYGASWTAFWNAGIFLDRGALTFWLPHPVQVFHWVYPPLAIGVFGATVLAAFTLGLWVPRLAARLPLAYQRGLVQAVAGVLVVCAAGTFAGGAVYDRVAPGQRISTYAIARDDRTGPLVHALADLRGRLVPPAEWPTLAVNEGIGIIRRPIVPMEQYLAGVDRSRLKPWNVVSIQIESLRADQLRAYGGSRDVMPTLDALAREGRVFTNAYIQASHSNYADLVPLSSQYPLRSATEYAYPPNPTYPRVLIYDVLKAVGYKTAIFSSQNENWGGMVNFHRPESLDRFFHAETFGGPTYTPWEDAGFARWVKQTKGAGSVDDRYTVGEAMQWIDGLGDLPFFLHMNLQSSHVPYVVPADFPHRFSPKTLDFTIMWGKFPLDKIDAVKDRYADSLFYEDTQIARLFEHLRRRGLWDRTIVLIGGDNGEAFYEHGFPSHAGELYNEVMKVPMIVRVPGLEGSRDDRPAMFLDVPPTVLDLLGLPGHPGFQGISLFEWRIDRDRSVYMIVQTPIAYQYAIVRGGFKLLLTERDGSRLLFDLTRDPGEKRNIATSRPDLVDSLTNRLQVWRTEQLNYYQDVARQAREYAPVLQD
jgi:arylsulfatase A-like enzyme